MKNIKMRFIAWIGLLAVCLLPIGAQAAEHYKSGIIGSVEDPGVYNWACVFDGKNTIEVPIDADGSFVVDLKPGKYVLTPVYIPVYVPGQPFPNFILGGPPIPVKVTGHHFTFVEIPVYRVPPLPGGGGGGITFLP